ncbi:hypothetical protein BDZ89DRAFT_1134274 [Hymenopellis radicata]|nr:hypothetical protein BDZ89DRAFT_1134274 [Hymenopellis radicata]
MVSLGALVHTFMKNDSPLASPTKRYGTVFPADFNIFSLVEPEEDADSTWEFTAPRPLLCEIAHHSAEPVLSPAQAFALKYRQQLTIEVPARAASPSPISAEASEDETVVENASPASTTSNETLPGGTQGAPLRHDPACEEILATSGAEAIAEMEKWGASPRDLLVCPRSGCRDTLLNARALKMHLALHDIADETDELTFECLECEIRFETQQALDMHHCRELPPMPLFSPTAAMFKRLFSPFASSHAN